MVLSAHSRSQPYVKRDAAGQLDLYAVLPLLRGFAVNTKGNFWHRYGMLPEAKLKGSSVRDPEHALMLQMREACGIVGLLPDKLPALRQGDAQNVSCCGFDDTEGSIRKRMRELIHHFALNSGSEQMRARLLPKRLQDDATANGALPFELPWQGRELHQLPPRAALEYILLQLALSLEAMVPVFDEHFLEYLPEGPVQRHPAAQLMLLPCKDTDLESGFSDERRVAEWRVSACLDHMAGTARLKHNQYSAYIMLQPHGIVIARIHLRIAEKVLPLCSSCAHVLGWQRSQNAMRMSCQLIAARLQIAVQCAGSHVLNVMHIYAGLEDV